jgi:ABC-2 type transport system ATP-binding protein
MTSVVIETKDLVKRYGKFTAVDKLNLTIKEGEVYGLLGPNGSGKTTTILMLLGLTEPTSGSVRVVSFDPSREPLEVKRRVGYLPDAVGFYDELSARENLRYSASLMGLNANETKTRVDEVLTRMRLADVATKRVGAFSRGMRQRLGLAEVLLKKPSVAILDEPTASLDPQSAHEFLDLIRELKHEGITVLLSSHLLHQVQEVCDRVGLFRTGRLELEGTVKELAQQVLGSAYHIEIEARGNNLLDDLKRIEGVVNVTPVVHETPGEVARYRVEARQDLRPRLATTLTSHGAELYNLTLEERSLDDVYNHHFDQHYGEKGGSHDTSNYARR